jgi:hypothetical protein
VLDDAERMSALARREFVLRRGTSEFCPLRFVGGGVSGVL